MWTAYPAQLQADLALALRVTTSGQGEVSLGDRRSSQFRLPTLGCLGVGGTQAQAQPVQTIWGLLYDASHLMDQVQDNDPGPLPTIDRTLTAATATFFEASARIADLDAPFRTVIFDHMRQVVNGQAAEIYCSRPSTEDSVHLAENKTGAFLSLGLVLGAMAGGATDSQIAALRAFGLASGVLLQILDDMDWLESLGNEAGLGQERDTNFVLVAAREHAGPAAQEAISSALDALRTESTLAPGQALREALVAHGVRARCALLAAQYAAKAKVALSQAALIDPAVEAALSRLSVGVIEAFRPRS